MIAVRCHGLRGELIKYAYTCVRARANDFERCVRVHARIDGDYYERVRQLHDSGKSADTAK